MIPHGSSLPQKNNLATKIKSLVLATLRVVWLPKKKCLLPILTLRGGKNSQVPKCNGQVLKLVIGIQCYCYMHLTNWTKDMLII